MSLNTVVVEGIVRRYLIAAGKGGVPDYIEHNYVFDITDDEDMVLTADYISRFEGRLVRITIEEIPDPDL